MAITVAYLWRKYETAMVSNMKMKSVSEETSSKIENVGINRGEEGCRTWPLERTRRVARRRASRQRGSGAAGSSGQHHAAFFFFFFFFSSV